MKGNQLACTVICILSAAHSLFAQNESLNLSKRVIKSGHWCSEYSPGLLSLHDGDTLFLHKKVGKHCTHNMKFGTGNRFLLKEFGNTYSGEPFVESKTKGKWYLEKGPTQILILDFETDRIELQLIGSKDDSMEFVVKNSL